MNQPLRDNHPGWQWCTAEGAELHTLLMGLQSSFPEKLRWLEDAETLVITMRKSTKRLDDHNELQVDASEEGVSVLREDSFPIQNS